MSEEKNKDKKDKSEENLEGKPVPSVSLESTEGKSVNLPEDIKGSWTILYFYPKDDTPGCTKQACTYTSNLPDFEAVDGKIYGISLDDMESHRKFSEKYKLNFPLLSDPNHVLSEALGVYGDQSFMGKIYQGLSRDSFLVDPEGIIRKVWRKVNPKATVTETLDEIKRLKVAG